MKNKKYKALTLVELLVVIAIMGILTAIVMVSLAKSRRNKDVELAAREVAAAIREAQNDSLTGKNASEGCLNVNYFITTSGSPFYSIAGCNGQSYQLKSGVLFRNSRKIKFLVPHGDIESGDSQLIRLQSGTSSSWYTVCVCPSGNIVEKAGNITSCAAATDPMCE